jgi:hypothetical protein
LPVAPRLHITSGDIAGEVLAGSGLDGDILVWHDLLYEGPRSPGWPDDRILERRSRFIEQMSGGGLRAGEVLATFKEQYGRIADLSEDVQVVLWFDACLFDQSMLVHILNCLDMKKIRAGAELLCIDRFEGVEPFIGLGQLSPLQLASVWPDRRPLTGEQFSYAARIDHIFAENDFHRAEQISKQHGAPLPWVSAALKRWLEERPDPATGLGRLESMALDAVRAGYCKPWDIFNHVAAAETPPQFWGDTTLWLKINNLAGRRPPLVTITGPSERLPQWICSVDLNEFAVRPC